MEVTADHLLQKICDSAREVYFKDMPPVKIVVTDDPHFESSSCVGFWRDSEKTIYLKPKHVKGVPFEEIQDTIKHELVHAWVHWKGLDAEEFDHHGRPFLEKAIEVDINLTGLFLEYPLAKRLYNRIKEGKIKPPKAEKPVEKPKVVSRPSLPRPKAVQAVRYESENMGLVDVSGIALGIFLYAVLALFGILSLYGFSTLF